jgi:hypothetical protein
MDMTNHAMWVSGLILLFFAVVGAARFARGKAVAKRAKMNELDRLRIAAEAGLRKRLGSFSSSEKYADEAMAIRDAATEAKDLPLMRLLARFSETSNPSVIRSAALTLRENKNGHEALGSLTTDHFTVYQAIMTACIVRVYDPTDESGLSTSAKRLNLSRLLKHALANVDDGHLLLSIVEERDLIDYRQVLDVLTQMKLVGPTPLAEGAL